MITERETKTGFGFCASNCSGKVENCAKHAIEIATFAGSFQFFGHKSKTASLGSYILAPLESSLNSAPDVCVSKKSNWGFIVSEAAEEGALRSPEIVFGP